MIMTKGFFMKKTGRLIQLEDRTENLQEMFNKVCPGHKIDWQAFPFENLWERYRIRSPKAHRIQRLYRQAELEKQKIVDGMLEN